MFEFRWTLPGPSKREARLRIRARSGWIGRKLLCVDDRILYNRRWFGGINHQFGHPDDPNETVVLRAVRDPASRLWHPELTCGGEILSETTGVAPPPVPDRPTSVAVVTGVTYLGMLMAVVMWGHIWKMLESSLGHSDSRAFVLAVEREPSAGMRMRQDPLPPAAVDEPYEAWISVEGGRPPYRWERTAGRMPRGLVFDETTARISGTPLTSGDGVVGFRVTDAAEAVAEWSYVVSIEAKSRAGPRIVTRALPAGRENQPYRAQLEVVGGKPPYRWVVNDRKLPKGLAFHSDAETPDAAGGWATLTGIVETNIGEKISALGANLQTIIRNSTTIDVSPPGSGRSQGPVITFGDPETEQTVTVCGIGVQDDFYPVRFRVYDSTYSPYEHLAAWFVPFAATALCLLGFWNMRRWSVVLYGVLIVGQAAVPLLGEAYPLPTSAVAIVLQGLVFCTGATSFGRMR